jgi:hypothetical protein
MDYVDRRVEVIGMGKLNSRKMQRISDEFFRKNGTEEKKDNRGSCSSILSRGRKGRHNHWS